MEIAEEGWSENQRKEEENVRSVETYLLHDGEFVEVHDPVNEKEQDGVDGRECESERHQKQTSMLPLKGRRTLDRFPVPTNIEKPKRALIKVVAENFGESFC